jgi:hypothetical protein
MIDLHLIKKGTARNNPNWPEIDTEVIWESSNCKIIDEFIGGIAENRLYHVIYNGEEIGNFKQDFSKNIVNQIKGVFLAKFPNITFDR